MQKHLKHLHKVLLIGLFACLLVLPVEVQAANNLIAKNSNNEQMKLIHNDVKVNDLDIEPMDTQKVKKSVVPDTKKESKKVMALFLRAMCAVILCAILLYFILIFVKKYYGSAFVNVDDEEYFETLDLSTPNNKQDALKSFLNRTR